MLSLTLTGRIQRGAVEHMHRSFLLSTPPSVDHATEAAFKSPKQVRICPSFPLRVQQRSLSPFFPLPVFCPLLPLSLTVPGAEMAVAERAPEPLLLIPARLYRELGSVGDSSSSWQVPSPYPSPPPSFFPPPPPCSLPAWE